MIEKVNPSHPDKVADRIAGAIVDLAYKNNSNPKIAVEVLIGHGKCHAIIETTAILNTNNIKSTINPRVVIIVEIRLKGRISERTTRFLLLPIPLNTFFSKKFITILRMKARQKPTITGAKILRIPDRNPATAVKFCETVNSTIPNVIIPRIILIFFFENSIFYVLLLQISIETHIIQYYIPKYFIFQGLYIVHNAKKIPENFM